MPRSPIQSAWWPTAALLGFGLLGGCQSDSRPPAIGEAFAGPAKLPLRQEISLLSPVVASVHHGDRLELLAQRRRFAKVRTAAGIEGWTEDRNLMERAELEDLQHFSEMCLRYPSQGQASVYDAVNVHTQTVRTAPSYIQIAPGEKVDVIGHQFAPRTEPRRKPLLRPQPKARPERKPVRQPRTALPPKPAGPPPPANWQELSRQRSLPQPPPAPAEPPVEAPRDEWSLVRNAAGQSGWVLTRRLSMAVPDDVAQYAEGRRITSYFSLGKISDDGKTHDIWMWTTVDSGEHDYDFDSYRVFTWSLRHHRYETAYIQRRIEGHAPVLRNTVDGHAGFAVCVDSHGQRVRKQYVLLENAVKPAGESSCGESGAAQASAPAPSNNTDVPGAASPSLRQKLQERWDRLRQRMRSKP